MDKKKKEEILQEFSDYMTRRTMEQKWTTETVRELCSMGLLKYASMMKVLIKKDFEVFLQQKKEQAKHTGFMLELSVKYDCTLAFVKNAIYYRGDIRL